MFSGEDDLLQSSEINLPPCPKQRRRRTDRAPSIDVDPPLEEVFKQTSPGFAQVLSEYAYFWTVTPLRILLENSLDSRRRIFVRAVFFYFFLVVLSAELALVTKLTVSV